MDDNVPKQLMLNNLRSGIPALTDAKANVLIEACVWCFIKCEHNNGVKIKSIHCDNRAQYSIGWIDSEIDIDALVRAYNRDDAVEYGAEAITFLLIREFTPFTAITRAVTGEGIDYWLGYENNDSINLFSQADARLEISGILVERGSNTIKNRIKAKIKQTKPTDHTFPVYISVVEFSEPKSEMVMKNATN
ncbi:MAG: hypothetical protein ACFFDT_00130 [Candidatus Hodarchaeota archaeon]